MLPSSELPTSEGRLPGVENLHHWRPEELMQAFEHEDRLWTASLAAVRAQIIETAEQMQQSWRLGGRIIYVGAGTSGRLGAVDAAEWGPTFGVDPQRFVVLMAGGEAAFRRAIEGAEDDTVAARRALQSLPLQADDFVLAITASGGTPFVLEALRVAQEVGARRALLSTRSSLDDAELLHVPLGSGAEILSGSTRLKAAAATQGILQRLSNLCALGLGWIYAGQMVEMRPTNSKLRARAVRIICQIAEVSAADGERWLERADDDIKVALLCARCGVTPGEARRRLQEVGRDLAQIAEFA